MNNLKHVLIITNQKEKGRRLKYGMKCTDLLDMIGFMLTVAQRGFCK